MSFFESLFSNTGSYSNIGTAILGGLSSAFGGDDSGADKKAQLKAGNEQRKSALFEARLEDYYKQRDRGEKRNAFGNYTQFGNLSSWAPNYQNQHTPLPVPTVPNPVGDNDYYAGQASGMGSGTGGGSSGTRDLSRLSKKQRKRLLKLEALAGGGGG